MSTSFLSIASLVIMFNVPQIAVDAAPISILSLTPDEKCSLRFDAKLLPATLQNIRH
ncbi:32266_t:CDS:2 [Gigaspora margarita]|uniref:32266_t:CDS:1 n=1 Tax=Gigaspora margarita TaxID=4874 RepID=A0ABM8W562_GIGMA|nr:32266_t:CDS:2 [Gigaspora margarita]